MEKRRQDNWFRQQRCREQRVQDTTWVSLMATQGRCGSSSWNTKVKCSNIFFNFKAMVEKEKGVNIKFLRSDGGGK
jgi:hypothetical protein